MVPLQLHLQEQLLVLQPVPVEVHHLLPCHRHQPVLLQELPPRLVQLRQVSQKAQLLAVLVLRAALAQELLVLPQVQQPQQGSDQLPVCQEAVPEHLRVLRSTVAAIAAAVAASAIAQLDAVFGECALFECS